MLILRHVVASLVESPLNKSFCNFLVLQQTLQRNVTNRVSGFGGTQQKKTLVADTNWPCGET